MARERRTRNRFMRLMVFFDLPVASKEDRAIYARFRKFLIEDGYDMLQFSVYCRIVNGEDAVDKHLNRLKKALPPKRLRALPSDYRQAVRGDESAGRHADENGKILDSRQTLLF